MEHVFETIARAHSHLARKRVLADVKALARDAEDLLKATAGDLQASVKQARARLGAAVEQVRATSSDMEKRSMARTRASALWADEVIRKNPYNAVGVIFGVGVLVGALIARGAVGKNR